MSNFDDFDNNHRSQKVESLFRDSSLFFLSIVKLFSSLETKMILKIPNETFLRITRSRIHFFVTSLSPYFLFSPLYQSAHLEIDPSRMISCQNSGKTEFECQNHPQYLLWHPQEKRFVLCATHAGEPRFASYNYF